MILPIEKQLTSLELSRELKELGVRQDTAYVWYTNGPHVSILPCPDGLRPMESKTYSAYTLAELLKIMPAACHKIARRDPGHRGAWLSLDKSEDGTFGCGYGEGVYNFVEHEDTTPQDACARMIIYLFKNKLIDVSSLGEDK